MMRQRLLVGAAAALLIGGSLGLAQDRAAAGAWRQQAIAAGISEAAIEKMIAEAALQKAIEAGPQDGGDHLGPDAVQASPEKIEEEMREVAARHKVPYEVVLCADAIGTWRGVGPRGTLVAVNYFEFVGDGTLGGQKVTGYTEQYDFHSPSIRVMVSGQLIRVNAGNKAWTEEGKPGMSPSDATNGGSVARVYAGLYPLGFMHAVMASGDQLRITGPRNAMTIVAARDGQTFTAVLDETMRPKSISTEVNEPAIGRGTLVAEYADYRPDTHGVMSPRHIVRKLNGRPLLDIRIPKTPKQNPYVLFPEPDVLRGKVRQPEILENPNPTFSDPNAQPPRRADGRPDLSGYWQTGGPADLAALLRTFGPLEPSLKLDDVAFSVNIPGRTGSYNSFENDSGVMDEMSPHRPIYKPEHWDAVRYADLHGNRTDPTWQCWGNGVPRQGPPQRIFQEDAEIMFVNNGQWWRVVPVDGRERDPIRANDQAYSGDSLGRWEGDTLVVETVGFSDASWLDWRGYIHSTSLKVTERFTRKGDEMLYQVTVEDPDILIQPWVWPDRMLRINRNLKAAQILQDPPCTQTDPATVPPFHRG
jgi:hypothetical protein